MCDFPETYICDFHDENAVKRMAYSPLGKTGINVSKLSLGTGGFSQLYGGFDLEECKKTVRGALKSGINYIDTAPWYGQGTSEETLGKCLDGIPRKAYYIATKIGRYELDPKLMFDFSPEKTRGSLELSLKRLGLDYVDIIQVHDIEFAPSLEYLIDNTLPVLEEFVKQGKARFIGITGYPVIELAKLFEKSRVKIDSVLSYSRMSLFDDSLENALEMFEGVGIVNAAYLAMGLLTNGGPQPWHPAGSAIKDACLKARNYCKENDVELAKLAMHYVYSKKSIHTHLVGMNTVDLLKSNLDTFYNGLNGKEKKVLEHIMQNIFLDLKEKHWEGVEIKKYIGQLQM
ncbi:PREDICTED: L-galactose dehydrogenase-like [Nicrophorus vespilloides]|uniref:L-galactose dehydrogenase-like n=1 Tax=Nicrophorus vespilloides TaxID=110193 RepID=A0ABM1N8I3_NICVS|nr:PREDICTED: L-galactose dehydrogenase-like [Nicrophorus vespilloides]